MRIRPARLATGIVVAILSVAIAFGGWNAHRPVAGVAATLGALPARSPSLELTWPAYGYAAIGATNFGVLAARGEQIPRPIASISKVITALAVLERTPLQLGEQGPAYTMTDADVARFNDYVARDGSVTPVIPGMQISQYQALQAVLLPSSNNMADSLAAWTFGSVDAYLAYANQMVQRLKMTNTTVGGDASGLSPATVSTPSDLVLLGEAALKHPVLAQIMAQTTANLPIATVYSTNSLLGQNGVIGIKTGTSDEAGGCLLSAAQYELDGGQKVTVIAAIIGTPDRGTVLADTPALLRSVKANFSYDTPVRAGAIIGTYSLPWGGTVTAVAGKSISLLRWNGDSIKTTAKLTPIQRSLAKGAKLGTVSSTARESVYASDVIAKEAVPGPTLWWRATRKL